MVVGLQMVGNGERLCCRSCLMGEVIVAAYGPDDLVASMTLGEVPRSLLKSPWVPRYQSFLT